MRTENQNPALDLFGHLLAPKGRYPARYVDIFWNRDDALRVKEVEVIFIPRREVEPMLGEKRADEFWREYAAYNGRWESDLGNSTSDWLTDKGYTPEDIFWASPASWFCFGGRG
jgi:hypothetical protein